MAVGGNKLIQPDKQKLASTQWTFGRLTRITIAKAAAAT
jgi:hypothetical protein